MTLMIIIIIKLFSFMVNNCCHWKVSSISSCYVFAAHYIDTPVSNREAHAPTYGGQLIPVEN